MKKEEILLLNAKLLKAQAMLAEFNASNYQRARQGYAPAYDNSDDIQAICDDIINVLTQHLSH